VRAIIDSYRGNWSEIRRKAEAALAALPTEDSVCHTLVAITLGDIHGAAGDMAAAHKARAEAARACEAIGSPHYELVANLKLAKTLRE
jgi:ATP/maltotriose-dependent transcriptional regulator MalT